MEAVSSPLVSNTNAFWGLIGLYRGHNCCNGGHKESHSAEPHRIAIIGGKGIEARNTPNEITSKCNYIFNLSKNQLNNLLYPRKMSAKVDNSAIQDNCFLCHHNIAFDCNGNWSSCNKDK